MPVLTEQGHQLISTDLRPRLKSIHKMDVTDLNLVMEEIQRSEADFIFHFAAETDVDLCQQDPDHAFRVNTLGTENLALAAQRFNIPLLYISTAGVFGGEKAEPYTEFDTPNPVNVYGESKLQGERIVQKLLSRFFIVRAGWMVGGWELDKKFVFKIIQQINQGSKEIKAVDDKIGTPTFTKAFAANLMPVVHSGRYGFYHLTNQGRCSRYEMAVKIVELMGLKDQVKVVPVSSDEFPLPAPRARSEMMRNYRLDLLGLNRMPRWEESLLEYIEENMSSSEK